MEFVPCVVLLLAVAALERHHALPSVIDSSVGNGNYNRHEHSGDGNVKYIRYSARQLREQSPGHAEDESPPRQVPAGNTSSPWWKMPTVVAAVNSTQDHLRLSRLEIATTALQNFGSYQHEPVEAALVSLQLEVLQKYKEDSRRYLFEEQLIISAAVLTTSAVGASGAAPKWVI